MNTLLKRRKRKSKRQAASIRNRLHQLESLEKRELLAGDVAGGNLVEMESSAKTEIKAAYVAPAPAAAVVQEASKDDRPLEAEDPRINLVAEFVDSLLSTLEGDGASVDLGGVLGNLGTQADDGTRVAPFSTSDTASFLDSLLGRAADGMTVGEADPIDILIGAHLGHAAVNLGDTGIPDIGGSAAAEPTLKDLTGPSNNSLLSEYKGALSTVPDDSSKLPESKHQDGNTTTATEPDEEPSKLEKVKKAVKDAWKTAKEGEIVEAVVQLGQDLIDIATEGFPKIFGGNPKTSNPDPTGDPAAFLSIADLVAFEQRMRERSPADPPEPDDGGGNDIARLESSIKLNRWNLINPVPDGEDAGGGSDGNGTEAPVPQSNPLTNPPKPEGGGNGAPPRTPRPEPIPGLK